jgi:hypothetical protein
MLAADYKEAAVRRADGSIPRPSRVPTLSSPGIESWVPINNTEKESQSCSKVKKSQFFKKANLFDGFSAE